MGGTIHQASMYGFFAVGSWRQRLLESVSPFLMSSRIRYPANFGFLVHESVMEAVRSSISLPWTQTTQEDFESINGLARSPQSR